MNRVLYYCGVGTGQGMYMDYYGAHQCVWLPLAVKVVGGDHLKQSGAMPLGNSVGKTKLTLQVSSSSTAYMRFIRRHFALAL